MFFLDEEGRMMRFPVSWTDASPPDPFIAVSNGRAHFRPVDLLRLVDLLERLGDLRGDPPCKDNSVKS